MKSIGFTMLLLGIAGVAVAQAQGPVATPEIDPTATIGALVLLSGALLVLRARRKN